MLAVNFRLMIWDNLPLPQIFIKGRNTFFLRIFDVFHGFPLFSRNYSGSSLEQKQNIAIMPTLTESMLLAVNLNSPVFFFC
jgi:hypothetical protein